MSEQDMQAELERLKAENDRLKAQEKRPGGIHFKVSQKGAVSVYGLGRFPVTLYKEQWQKLLAKKNELLEFIRANDADLKKKGD